MEDAEVKQLRAKVASLETEVKQLKANQLRLNGIIEQLRASVRSVRAKQSTDNHNGRFLGTRQIGKS